MFLSTASILCSLCVLTFKVLYLSPMKVMQPGPATHVYIDSKPENYLVLSVLTMFFCCFICGLIALIYSLQVGKVVSHECVGFLMP